MHCYDNNLYMNIQFLYEYQFLINLYVQGV